MKSDRWKSWGNMKKLHCQKAYLYLQKCLQEYLLISTAFLKLFPQNCRDIFNETFLHTSPKDHLYYHLSRKFKFHKIFDEMSEENIQISLFMRNKS